VIDAAVSSVPVRSTELLATRFLRRIWTCGDLPHYPKLTPTTARRNHRDLRDPGGQRRHRPSERSSAV